MKYLSFVLILFSLVSCQINIMDPAQGPTIVPDLDAKIARRLYLDGKDERMVRGEDQYVYNAAGQLDRVDHVSFNSNNGTTRRYGHDAYTYNSTGQLTRIIYYAQTGINGTDNFQPSLMREFSYPTSNRITELFYYNNLSANGGGWTASYRVETTLLGTTPIQTMRYGASQQQSRIVSSETYQYEGGRLVSVEFREGSGNLGSTMRYQYRGRTATVELVLPKGSSPSMQQALLYDSRGRLIRERNTSFGIYPSIRQQYNFIAPSNYTLVYEYLD